MARITPNRLPDKLPDEELDYAIDWSAALDGDTIAEQSVEVAAGGMSVDRVAADGGVVSFWLSGGTPGFGRLLCTVETAGGRTLEAAMSILIRAA